MYNNNNNQKPLFRGFFCFEKYFTIVFLFTSIFLFSQEKLIKRRDIQSNEIEIIADGLDDILIENSTNNQIEVILLDENPNTHTIFFEDESQVLKVKFELNFKTSPEAVFRKFITKRLQRAKVIVKIPRNKNVIIYGKTIGVTSENYQGDLKIYIEKGNVKLNTVKGNTLVKLFLGNVYAQLGINSNINVETINGEIRINKKGLMNQSYIKIAKKAVYNFNVKSINANVILITE